MFKNCHRCRLLISDVGQHCSFRKQFLFKSRMTPHHFAIVTWEIFSVFIFLGDKWSIREGWDIYPNLQALLPWTLTCEVLLRTLQDLRHNIGMWCVNFPPQEYKKYATMLYVINVALAPVVDNSGMLDFKLSPRSECRMLSSG